MIWNLRTMRSRRSNGLPNCGYANPQFFFEGTVLPELVECAICGVEYVVEFWEFVEAND